MKWNELIDRWPLSWRRTVRELEAEKLKTWLALVSTQHKLIEANNGLITQRELICKLSGCEVRDAALHAHKDTMRKYSLYRVDAFIKVTDALLDAAAARELIKVVGESLVDDMRRQITDHLRKHWGAKQQ